MRYVVELSRGAIRDLEEICAFVVDADSEAKADRLLDRLASTLQVLTSHPERGAHPNELRALGIKEFRHVFFKPYRLIYRIVGQRVMVYLAIDRRRDVQSLLTRRLFAS